MGISLLGDDGASESKIDTLGTETTGSNPSAPGEEDDIQEPEDMSKFTEETTPTLTHEEQEQLNTRLFTAITRHDTSKEDLEALIAAGANVNAANQYGTTALMSTGGDTEITKTLIAAGANVNAANQYGTTALMLARGRTAVVKTLIIAGATVDNVDKKGNTALMFAAWYGTDSVKILIEAKADVDARDQDGMTALMFAARVGNRDSVKTLIEAGAKVDSVDQYGTTALKYAVEYGDAEVINALINAGADVKVGWGSDTPLVFATQNGYTEAIDALNSHNQRLNQVANFLIDRADIDGQGRIRVNVNNLNDNEKALLEDAKRFNTNNIQEALQATGREKGIDEEIARLMMEDVKTHDPLNYKTYLSIPKVKGKHLNEGVMTEIFSFLPKEDQSNLRFAGILQKDAATRENATRAPAAVAVAGGGVDPNSYHTEVRKKAQEIGKELSDAQPDYNQQNTSGKRKREPTEVTTGDEKRIRLDAQQARVDPNDPRKPSSNTPPPPPSSPKGGHGI